MLYATTHNYVATRALSLTFSHVVCRAPPPFGNVWVIHTAVCLVVQVSEVTPHGVSARSTVLLLETATIPIFHVTVTSRETHPAACLTLQGLNKTLGWWWW